ncbi:von Willebrand factor A domain-containing protein 7 Protein G7c Precursor [Larimichthys crocea]|uniref:von Willebrand factor A domain-containing protein 7 Protein G7c n=1 Tax=Larimichthys crocea TaxID=215358 RepID=A0A6G0I877_LARCR|nr:von Willebrand factor A domain-containing protein 7 Protein G7c Precursor [Larimichthys crocea]
MSGGLAVLCLLLLQTGAFGFQIIFGGGSLKHQDITERAILNATVQACRALALAEGTDFTFPPLNVESVAVACEASKSFKSFQKAIKVIQKKNWRVDIRFLLSSRRHFDDEDFIEGRKIITEGLSAVKASNKRENFEAAREKLGEILHTLQDFYSHSNWVEMENIFPNSNLIRSDTSIGNIAAKSRATCRNCDGDNCRKNILEDILQEKILTSGYFSLLPLFATKPEGKCSHGGTLDQTSGIKPKGGINKDKLTSEHGHLHVKAANLAIAATSELLEDIRGAAGDRPFLQMLGISRGSNKALCFVIDTTGSMSDDIAAVKTVTSSIINSRVGTEDEPSVYILVPFNDPDFGPLTRTTDPNVFKNAINALTATGGGDFPEMSLSGLQLALTGSPPNSEIFVFTDADAKDAHLRGTVIALIERTQSVVNFMLTGILGSRRRRQSHDNQGQQQLTRMAASGAQLYSDLAASSGGQAIKVSKSQLLEAVTIITESSSSSLVPLLQAARGPGKNENFTFTVDESVGKLTIYITGTSVSFTLISPSGESQQSTNTTGSLITSSRSVGNFRTLLLKTQVGLWEIKMVSASAYTLKVVGESSIDFLFDFLEVSQSLLGGFDVVDNRPRAGVNGSLTVTLTGTNSATVTEVILVKSSGSGQVNGSVKAQGGGDFLAHFDVIPSEDFVVVVKGRNINSSTRALPVIFQRQSPTSIRASTLSVTADDSNNVLVPGIPLSVPFTVTTNGTGGDFRIQATNDQGFTSNFPSTLSLVSGGSANGTVNLTAPPNTVSGTEVTLTVEAQAPGGTDTNYVVLRFTVLTTVTDFTRPVCELVSLQSNCSENCSLSMWELSVQVTDGAEGTGIDRITLKQGNGTVSTSLATSNSTMNTSLAAGNMNITLVSYNASCCSPDVDLLVVDRVGNVGSCFYSIRRTATNNSSQVNTTSSPQTTPETPTPTAETPASTAETPTPAPAVSSSTKTVQSLLFCFSLMIVGLNSAFKWG